MDAFERFLAEAHDPPQLLVAEARQSVSELSTELATLRVECALSGAKITLDGKELGVAPLKNPVRVTAGRHQLIAIYEGVPAATTNTDVLAGTVETVALRPRGLARAPSRLRGPVGTESLLSSRVSGASPPEDAGWLMGRSWTWVATGSAAVFAGGAVAAGMMMRSKFDALDQSCGRSSGQDYSGCKPSDLGAIDTWKNTANVLWGLSAAAALTAGVHFSVEGRNLVVTPVAGQELGLTASMRY
jgi:hypothetical protein